MRTPGRDAYKSGRHICGDAATRIRDPHAFATCFARGVEHRDVRTALEQPCTPGSLPPAAVEVPLTDLLGPDGPSWCDGYRLDPVNGSMDVAREQRKDWVNAIRHGEQPTVPEPAASHMSPEDFRDAVVVFPFQRSAAGTAWEVKTMYVDPERQAQP